MTSGSVSKRALDLSSGSAVTDGLITHKKVSNDSKNNLRSKKFVDLHEKGVLDEDFRFAVEKSLTGITRLPDNWNDLTLREQRDWVHDQFESYFTNMPKSLTFLCVGSTIYGDSGAAHDSVPEWLDRKKFQRGQCFAMDNFMGISLAKMLSLYMLFSFDHSVKPLIVTDKSSEPFTSFKRYLSTLRRVRNWYSTDVWTAGTNGYRDIQTVRKMHVNIRDKMNSWSSDEIKENATLPNTWSTTRTKMRKDFRDSCQEPAFRQCPLIKQEQSDGPKSLNQTDMSSTQFGFMGLVILYPESFGIYGASDEDLDAFCHVWRGLAYQLGIEDE